VQNGAVPHRKASRLQADLGAAPVSALGVVSDLVASAHSDPLRDGPVLLQLLGQRLLDAEGVTHASIFDSDISNITFVISS